MADTPKPQTEARKETVAENPSTFYSPMPGLFNQSGSDVNVDRAVLIDHSNAATQRGLFASQAALATQILCADTLKASAISDRVALENRYAHEKSIQDSERRTLVALESVRGELAAMREGNLRAENASLQAKLADVSAQTQTSVLSQLVTMVSKLADSVSRIPTVTP